jgi:hypothetical protein
MVAGVDKPALERHDFRPVPMPTLQPGHRGDLDLQVTGPHHGLVGREYINLA